MDEQGLKQHLDKLNIPADAQEYLQYCWNCGQHLEGLMIIHKNKRTVVSICFHWIVKSSFFKEHYSYLIRLIDKLINEAFQESDNIEAVFRIVFYNMTNEIYKMTVLGERQIIV